MITYRDTTFTTDRKLGSEILADGRLVNMPTTVNPGDLLVAFVTFTTGDPPTEGWTVVIGEAQSALVLFFRIADGTEDGTVVSFTPDPTLTSTADYPLVAGVARYSADAGITYAGRGFTTIPSNNRFVFNNSSDSVSLDEFLMAPDGTDLVSYMAASVNTGKITDDPAELLFSGDVTERGTVVENPAGRPWASVRLTVWDVLNVAAESHAVITLTDPATFAEVLTVSFGSVLSAFAEVVAVEGPFWGIPLSRYVRT